MSQATLKAPRRESWIVVVLAIVSAGIYFHLARLSECFTYGSDKIQRPIPAVLGWFTLLFVIHLVALWRGARIPFRHMAWFVMLSASLFRGIMLTSEPIQEVDIYRYLWDGIVTDTGISPFKYTPDEIKAAIRNPEAFRDHESQFAKDISQLAEVAKSSAAIETVLNRVHFGSVPTVYPPVSQWGFLLVEKLTPHDSALDGRLFRMRLWLVICDLGTLLVLLAILHCVDIPAAYGILYGWSPLVIKEIANSGHLDSMAVLLTTVACYFCVRLFPTKDSGQRPGGLGTATTAGAFLATGIAAKIYPLVLVPWFALLCFKRLHLRSVIPLAALLILTGVLLKPMFVVNAAERETVKRAPSDGIKAFFKYWEMNDLIFLATVENLRPDNTPRVWFAVLPNSFRQRLSDSLIRLGESMSGEFAGLDEAEKRQQATFQAARLLTVAALGLILLFVCRNAWQEDTPIGWLRAAMLCLAWFWLLSPTQNPWYWVWVMPLIPFARCRAWYLVAAAVMIYYLRFWLDYHFEEVFVLGTAYKGKTFFDMVVAWLEFGPLFALLAAESAYRRSRRTVTPA